MSAEPPTPNNGTLLQDLRSLIEETRSSVAIAVNAALAMLYWRVGERINDEILHRERATYGAEILPTLSAKLVPLYGGGFNVKNLHRMVQFAKIFLDKEIVATLSRQLRWSHFVEILTVKDALRWCANATDHAISFGGKPWRYLLIPHDAISTNMTLDALARRYGD